MSQLYTGKLRKADINTASSGDNTIITNPSSTGRIVIDFITLLPTSSVSIQLKDGATAYGGAMPLDTKQPFTFENTFHNDDGIISLSPGNNFVINLGSAVQCGGFVRYRVIGQ